LLGRRIDEQTDRRHEGGSRCTIALARSVVTQRASRMEYQADCMGTCKGRSMPVLDPGNATNLYRSYQGEIA
jgi:hypothetical protein